MHEEHREHGEHTQHDSHATHAKKSDMIKINKKTALTVGGLLVVGIGVFWGLSCLIAATVNGVPITRYAVMKGLERANGKAYLESLISERVIADEARNKGIVVKDEDIVADLANIEAGLTAQGASMDDLLAAQGMTRETLKKQMILRKKVELLLGEKVAVADAEVDKYIADAKLTIEEEKLAETRVAIREQLKGQKLQREAAAYVDALRASADVRLFGFYREDTSSK